MTFRALLAMMSKFAADHPDHGALDERVVIRVTSEEDGDGLHVGGLQRAIVDDGCTETFALTLDADQEPADQGSNEAFGEASDGKPN